VNTETILVVLVLLALAATPVWMALSVWQHFRDRERNAKSGGGSLGNALQELDRLVTRPSVEHKIEAEHQIKAIDEEGGE
jgi:hypothetical protein